MKRTIATLLGFILAIGVKANAMPISQYNRLSPDDGGHYVTLLVKGSVEGLEAHGNKKDADKLYRLFDSGNGTKQFFKNLAALNVLNKKNA